MAPALVRRDTCQECQPDTHGDRQLLMSATPSSNHRKALVLVGLVLRKHPISSLVSHHIFSSHTASMSIPEQLARRCGRETDTYSSTGASTASSCCSPIDAVQPPLCLGVKRSCSPPLLASIVCRRLFPVFCDTLTLTAKILAQSWPVRRCPSTASAMMRCRSGGGEPCSHHDMFASHWPISATRWQNCLASCLAPGSQASNC